MEVKINKELLSYILTNLSVNITDNKDIINMCKFKPIIGAVVLNEILDIEIIEYDIQFIVNNIHEITMFVMHFNYYYVIKHIEYLVELKCFKLLTYIQQYIEEIEFFEEKLN
jgi:hypothetical protein